jgi:ribosomal protein S18 acetylase RimI-like enzyme
MSALPAVPRHPASGCFADGTVAPKLAAVTVHERTRGDSVAGVREPTAGDAAAMGMVHVAAWQAAYRGGLMADDYLDGLSADERGRRWSETLARPARPREARFVAEDDAGTVVGFLVAGPAEGDEDSETGEVYAVNVHPEAWGEGHGRALCAAGTAALAEAGFEEVVLWVHRDNERARRFYERVGWRADGGQRRQEVLGAEVPEVRYRRNLPG